MSAWSQIKIPPAEVLNGVGSSAADRQLMLAADRTPVRVTYGEDRLTGRLLNAAPSSDGKFLVAQFLWGFECDSINDPLLNDRALPAGSAVTHYRGTQTTPPTVVVAALAAQGITYTTTLFGYAQSVVQIPIGLFDGQLNFSARVRGRRLYDPRKDSTNGGSGAHRLNDPTTWEWSDCPALAQADWTTNTLFGAGLPVVWSSVATLANANDQMLGSEKRRTIGLTLDAPADVRSVAEVFRAYSGSFALPTAAGVRFVADADGAAVADLTHENGDLLACDTMELRDTSTSPTAVEIIFSDRTKIPWRDGSAIAQVSGAGTTKPWRLSQVRMPGVTRFSQAMREAIERLNKLTLNDLSTVVEVAAEGIKYEEADIVRLSHPLGPVLKPMRISGPPIMTERGRWRLQLQEHDAAVYSDSVQTQATNPDSSFDNPAGPPGQVTGLAASVSTLLITITRTPSTELDYAYTQYEYSTNGGGTYNSIPAVPIGDGRSGATWQTSIQGALRIRARDIDTDNLAGAWSLAYDFTVGSEILPAWMSLAGKPRIFKVRSKGSGATNAPAGFDAGLFDGDTGALVADRRRSYAVVVLDNNGSVLFYQTYDVYGNGAIASPDGGFRSANELVSDLDAIKASSAYKNKTIVVFTFDEPRTNRTEALVVAMLQHGASRPIFERRMLGYGAYILVAKVGCGEANGAEDYGGDTLNSPDAWREMSFQISATGALLVTGGTGGARSVTDYGYLGSLDATTNKQYDQETDPVVSPGGVVDGAFWRVPSTKKKFQRIAGVWRFYTEDGTVGTGELAPGSATLLVRGFLLGPVQSFNDV